SEAPAPRLRDPRRAGPGRRRGDHSVDSRGRPPGRMTDRRVGLRMARHYLLTLLGPKLEGIPENHRRPREGAELGLHDRSLNTFRGRRSGKRAVYECSRHLPIAGDGEPGHDEPGHLEFEEAGTRSLPDWRHAGNDVGRRELRWDKRLFGITVARNRALVV